MLRLVLLLFSACLLVWPQSNAAWTPELSLRVRPVGSALPSPDGKMLLWMETEYAADAERSEQVSQVFVGRPGGRRLQLTRGDKSASSPSFSPDGRYVYFASERSGKNNIWRIAIDGGEAERLTDWKGPLGGYQVSPDGKWVAFAGAEPREDEEKARKEKRDFRIVDDNPAFHGLWLIPAEADTAGKRTPRKLYGSSRHVSGLRWSPDSRAIAFDHWPAPEADYWTGSDISEVDVESAQVRVLAATGAAESSPFYSPDGQWVACVRTSSPPRWPSDARVALLSRKGGEPRELGVTRDEAPAIVGWSADSSRLFIAESNGTTRAIYTLPLDGPPSVFYQPAKGTFGSAALNITGTHLGLTLETPETPQEAWLMTAKGGAPVMVSRANADLPLPRFGETRPIRWRAKDGLEIEGLLTYPAGYEKGRKYPLILNIHGGPAGVFGQSFVGGLSIYPLAVFSARGYAILRPNPRGSGGYGKKFRFANIADWGGEDYQDLMAGVDHLVQIGLADPDRMAVMGWSYGGFMTSWVITQTQRFKAAVVGAAVTNLWSFTGTADIPGFLPDYFKGEPWDNFAAYQKHSPMSHVKGVKTPALILHGEADIRVPVSQGYEFYNALKRQGVTTKMVVYPRTPHGPREPKFLLDIMQRHLDWVDKYVR